MSRRGSSKAEDPFLHKTEWSAMYYVALWGKLDVEKKKSLIFPSNWVTITIRWTHLGNYGTWKGHGTIILSKTLMVSEGTSQKPQMTPFLLPVLLCPLYSSVDWDVCIHLPAPTQSAPPPCTGSGSSRRLHSSATWALQPGKQGRKTGQRL